MMLCVTMMIGVTGCVEGLTPANVQALAAQQEVLQQQIDTVQTATAQMVEDLAAAEIVDADAVVKLAKINEEADRVQAQVDIIARALTDVPLTGDTTRDFIAQLQAANTASSGFNPYVVPAGAGLSILSILLAWLAKRKTDEVGVVKTKYQAHKQGVDLTMKEVSASTDPKVKAVEAQLYNNIGEARASLGV